MSNLKTDVGRGADETSNGFVRLQYRINNLKVKNPGPPPVLKNADVSETSFTDWGFNVLIHGRQNGNLQDKAYKLEIVRLPYEIVGKECYITAEDNFLFVWCKKKDTSQSWEVEITDDTLETAEPQ